MGLFELFGAALHVVRMEQRGVKKAKYTAVCLCVFFFLLFIASTAPFFSFVRPLAVVVRTTSLVVSYLGGYVERAVLVCKKRARRAQIDRIRFSRVRVSFVVIVVFR